ARLGSFRSSVTGTFETDDVFRAASLIVQPHGGTVQRITPWLIIISGP
ncbi:MAG: iron dicitrate transport regulator FecR, partial [Stutzerimonas stutzeri]